MGIDAAKDKVKVFHHMPKCGGTSLKNALGDWFTLVPDYITLEQLRGTSSVDKPLDFSFLAGKHCVCGHFESELNHLFDRYSRDDLSSAYIFTLVRDPLDLRISLYYYEIKEGRRDPFKESLSDYLKLGSNYMARRFPCEENSYVTVLNRYDFIGLQERLQESLDYLSIVFGKSAVTLENINVAPRDSQHLQLSDAETEEFKIRNRLDYLIYDHAVKRFNEDIGSEPTNCGPAKSGHIDTPVTIQNNSLGTFKKRSSTVDESIRQIRDSGLPIKAILDVGVLHGTPFLIDNFKGLKHYLFEPMEDHFAAIRKNYSQIDYELVHAALTDEDGEVNFKTIDKTGGGVATHGWIDTDAGDNVKKVKALKLDTYTQGRPEGPYLLKIDVDGPSVPAAILRGAIQTLNSCSVVVIEITVDQWFERAKILHDSAFQLWDITSLCYYRGCLWQFDAVFINRKYMSQYPNLSPMHQSPFDMTYWQQG